MKKIFKFAALAALAFSFASCESFLDTNNYWSKDSSNFPVNATDAEQMLAGIYNNLNSAIGANDGGNVGHDHFLWSIASSDDALGGGGQNDPQFQAEDLLMNVGADMYNGFYVTRYKGIARANAAIEALPNCGVEDKLAQYMGEAFFLRAWYYYELASMFGNIPCPVTSKADATQPQISGEALWGQIVEDCKIAADIMPATMSSGDGHVDKWAAIALMGRAYLFATGFYGLDGITLPAYSNEAIHVDIAEGTKLTKAEVGAYITDCVNNSGYTLVPDYHNLWAYTNRCSIEDANNPWKGHGYKWVEDDGARNPEAMFVIKFNTQPSWSTTIGYCNQTALFMGVREQKFSEGGMMPFGQGWGMCPVNPSFVDDWKQIEPTDQRLDASVLPVTSFTGYVYGGDSFIQETGYYHTKNMPVMAWSDDKGKYMMSFTNVMFPDLTWSDGNEDNYQLNSVNDMILIRFAEVLLMDAEINNNQASFDRVRARAGLPSRPINEENIRNERRWELNFEGVRFNDMRRYGESYAVAALDKQQGVKVWNLGVEDTNNAAKFNGGYGERYKATKGFIALPSSQISLSAGAGEQYKFTQNEGWGTQFEFSGWQ
jgi:hypothetical protein